MWSIRCLAVQVEGEEHERASAVGVLAVRASRKAVHLKSALVVTVVWAGAIIVLLRDW